MALNARLELRQGQGLVITPQLQQAIKLLQLSNLELDAFIEGELEKNPLLARDEAEEGGDPPAEAVASASPETELDGRPESGGAELDAPSDALDGDASPGDRQAEGAADAGGAVDWSRAGSGGGFDGEDGFEGALAAEPTLHDHLHAQLAAAPHLDAVDRVVAGVLIDAVDEGGYLRGDTLPVVAERLGCELARVERVLGVLQGFEPVGVAARSVAECLAIQLRERDRFDPAMATLIEHLELLARRDLSALQRVCGVDAEDLREMIAEVKALTPRPGAAFGAAPMQTVVPDVMVREDPLGGWRVELNSDTLPRLLVDQRYHATVSGRARSAADRTYVAEQLSEASWLVKSLDQRAKTILKVTSEIVRQQDAFLAFGVEHLRPLNLKHVADAIGMHESTVSRVTSNKYVATPRGVFELKFFFTSGLAATDGGEAHSAEAVRHRIKAMIEGEAQAADGDVLSDDRIVELLKETGVDIARRTVAKYREALRIPSSVERKRMLRTG